MGLLPSCGRLFCCALAELTAKRQPASNNLKWNAFMII